MLKIESTPIQVNSYGKGNYFGEIALLANTVR